MKEEVDRRRVGEYDARTRKVDVEGASRALHAGELLVDTRAQV